MSDERRRQLVALVEELLEEAEIERDDAIEDDASLIESGLLDSMALLQIAEWVDEQLGGCFDLKRTNIREEWDSIAGILAFVERSS